jgi:putative addiction module killer protein
VEIRKYQDRNGRVPFDEWMSALTDNRARKRIKIRIDRLMIGLEGDWKPVGSGVREMRVPGERLPW